MDVNCIQVMDQADSLVLLVTYRSAWSLIASVGSRHKLDQLRDCVVLMRFLGRFFSEKLTLQSALRYMYPVLYMLRHTLHSKAFLTGLHSVR